MNTKLKLLSLILVFLLLSIVSLWASGRCPKCGKIWNQPWAKSFTKCPEDGTPLIPIEKQKDTDNETIRAIKVKRINKEFPNYYRRRTALCIGINNYPNFPTIEYAASDAQSMAGVLKGYDFDEVYLLTNERATKRKIVNELLRFKAESENDDLFVFYFAGHGAAQRDYKGDEHGYLIPVDCRDENKIYEQGISMGLFKDICLTMPNKHILFLVDCCYSGYGLTRSIALKEKPEGGNINNYLGTITGKRAVQLLAAGGKNDLAHERAGHGIFTSYLLDVLEGNTIHKDDGVISALEMSSYIKKNVINQTKGRQNPAFGYLLGNGDVVFITGKQKRNIYSRNQLLTLEEIEALYEKTGEIGERGEYLFAERNMSKAYTHFRRYHSKDTAKHVRYLKRLMFVSNNMNKNDLTIYYSRELLEISVNELEHAIAYCNLGLAYQNKGDYDRDIEYYQKALNVGIKKLGPEHPNVASSYNNLGSAYDGKGDCDRAIEYHQKALKIWIKKLGPEHPDVGRSYNNLCLAYDSKGDYDRAIEYCQKALNVGINKLGPEHPHVATSYSNLGSAYDGKSDYDRAIEYYQKALDIRIKKLGPDHPDVARSYNNLALAYDSKGDCDRAIEYHQKALEIFIKKLGPEHPYIANIYNNLGSAYDGKGDYDRAIEYYQKALEIFIKKLGPEHPDVGRSYNNLCLAYDSKGDYDRAIEYCQKALNVGINKLGPEHPNVASSYNNLGSAYIGNGDYDYAIEYHQKALKILIKELGPEHPYIGNIYSNLALAYHGKGDYDHAIEYCQKALKIWIKKLGPEHPYVAANYTHLGLAYDSKGDYDRAIEYCQKALNIGIKRLGRNDPITKTFQKNLDSVKNK